MIVFFVITIVVLIITAFRYSVISDDHNRTRFAELIEQKEKLNYRLESAVETIQGIRALANYYLKYPKELPSKIPSLLQENDQFYLNIHRHQLIDNNKILSGNITGIGNIKNFDLALQTELKMANALTPAFVTAQESLKEANWLYYISMRRFVNLYPWVPRSIWQYSDKSLTNDLMRDIQSSSRIDGLFWSQPYVDSAGKGLNTALGTGVYLNGEMQGAVLIDINTAGLYDYLPEIESRDHGYIIVDKNNHVLLHKKDSDSTVNVQTTFEKEAPNGLDFLNYQQIIELEDNIEIGSWVVQKQKLNINDWILLEYQNKSDFYSLINFRFFSVITGLFAGLLTLLLIVYYVTHKTFIVPSRDFVNHIENCAEGDPGKIKPSADWLHWFRIVEDIFGQNRSLMQLLKDQNIELDLRVQEKTQALQKTSTQQQRDYALLRSVMNAIPDYILFNDPNGNLIGCNQSFEQLIRLREKDILGLSAKTFIKQGLGESAANCVGLPNTNGNIGSLQQVIITQSHTYEIYNSPFYNESGVLLGAICLIRDVSEQYAANQALELAKNQAETANKIKSQFLANMSHEIRTPINAMQGMVFLLQQSQINKIQHQYLENAKTASTALLYLVDELLDSAKVESGNMTIHKELCDIEKIVAQALILNVATVARKKLRIYVDIDNNVPLCVETDRMRLVQVISNLLNNAIKFTDKGHVSLSITAAIEDNVEDVSMLKFSVKDTGIGIEKNKQARLFEAFKQADESMTRLYGGTGLGLSICQHIAHLLGGEITIDSELGQGAEFNVTIPMAYESPMFEQDIEILSRYSLYSLTIDIPATVHDNFANIEQKILSLPALAYLKEHSNHADNMLFIDSQQFNEGFDAIELQLLKTHVKLLILCQPIATIISSALVEQIAKHQINYVLVELPLYRNVIGKIINELRLIPNLANQTPTTNDRSIKKESKPDLSDLAVLLVEDNIMNQLVAMKLIESMNAKVIIAQNGQEAIDILAKQDVDVVLMDIQMPVMDGLTATQHIRSQGRTKHLPIIAMTAHARAEDREQCLSAGMDMHIAKPVNVDKLRHSILHVLKITHRL